MQAVPSNNGNAPNGGGNPSNVNANANVEAEAHTHPPTASSRPPCPSPVGVMDGVPMGFPGRVNGIPLRFPDVGFPGGGVNGNGMGGVNRNGMGVNGMGIGMTGMVGVGAGGYPKEYSIFVGDLAPETSNSDLVAVFRNPILGLRNDRAPTFIRPFASCKSAKIMLDLVTGVSRGYGFTDEADQQRALIEMHGLYCLSRPMCISPATAKFKRPQPDLGPGALPASASAPSYLSVSSTTPLSASVSVSALPGEQQQPQQAPSVSAPIAVLHARRAQHQRKRRGGGALCAAIVWRAAAAGAGAAQQRTGPAAPAARAILGNLIGLNGEQLTSTDPYNTTVFVGGLSPLVGEATLRTLFVPFWKIHYVKVPVGKHCGFVQFVRKADAERAIEKMQGFPVGGSRIRLNWGRSQYNAAQAAAQAAQAAALAQAQAQAPAQAQAGGVTAAKTANVNGPGITPVMMQGMTHEQAIMLFQKFQMQVPNQQGQQQQTQKEQPQQQKQGMGGLYAAAEFLGKRRDSYAGHEHGAPYSAHTAGLPHPSKAYVPGFFPVPPTLQTPVGANGGGGKMGMGMGMGSGSGSPTRGGGYGGGGGFAGSPPAFQINRYQSHHAQTHPISRSARKHRGEFDALHDLNGTLASLDLHCEREREFAIGKRHEGVEHEQRGERAVSDDDGEDAVTVNKRPPVDGWMDGWLWSYCLVVARPPLSCRRRHRLVITSLRANPPLRHPARDSSPLPPNARKRPP
ncbi:hypothetical protein B0H13DRAFT_2380614 [Mycena leptocephala]|nr:hypothetical protein B0H13DRAFT_2380614 [Mycena leptocephala]